ncbi:MAG: type II toxin-antitoxin system death-on-curing family toxin [Thermoanaerobaculia bacterium]
MRSKSTEPLWVSRLAVDAVHADQLREHGGLAGIRDENVLESALARARNKWAYKQSTDLATLAAAYGFGIATSHPYKDGNKRIAFLAMMIFLGLNDFELTASEADVVVTILSVADGQLSEAELAKWLSHHITRVPKR